MIKVLAVVRGNALEPIHDIGYMQVHLKIFRKGDLFDSFAINAFDECFMVKTKLVCCEHKAIDDPADKNGKVVQFIIRIPKHADTIALLMPVHQSEEWEVVNFIGSIYSCFLVHSWTTWKGTEKRLTDFFAS